jgi:hypothetical protein
MSMRRAPRHRRAAQAGSERVERVRRWLVAVLCALAVLTAGSLAPARADEQARYAPGLAAVAAGYEQLENQLAACPPVCPEPVHRRQWVTLRFTDTWLDEDFYQVRHLNRIVYQAEGRAGTGTVHTFRVSRLAGGVTHCFGLTARSTGGDQAYSAVCAAAAPPGKPSGAQVVWSSADAIDVQVRRPEAFEGTYRVEVRRDGQTAWTVRSAPPFEPAPTGSRRLRVVGLEPSSRYCLRVRTFHGLGQSAPTDVVCGSTVRSPTAGWQKYRDEFTVQQPWNLQVRDRYRYDGATNTHTTWVYADDEPLGPGSDTDPRTEMRWSHDYRSGQRMWEADVHVVGGTDGASIVQIIRERGAGTPATDFMLRAYDQNNGTLRRYTDRGEVVATSIYNRWVNIKVEHAPELRMIRVYVDDRLALTTTDNGPASRNFKNGVYHKGEGRAEARFRNITFWSR